MGVNPVIPAKAGTHTPFAKGEGPGMTVVPS